MPDRALSRRSLLAACSGVAIALGSGCLGGLRADPTARGVARAPRTLLGLWEYNQRPYWLLRNEPGWLGSHEAMFSGNDGTRAGYDLAVRSAHFAGADLARSAADRIDSSYLQRLFRTRFPEQPAPVSEPLPPAGRTQRVFQYASVAEQPAAGSSYFLVTSANGMVLLLESTGLSTLVLSAWADMLLAPYA